MYNYEIGAMLDLIGGIIMTKVTPETWDWLQKMGDTKNGAGNFNTAFIIAPRKSGKSLVEVNIEQINRLEAIRSYFSIDGWTIDRLCRVWLLLQLDATDKDKYHRTIENLFLAAEMNELVALYSALPLLAYPEMWVKRCSEGIRSNIGGVLEAIMYNNPYPAKNLEQAAWNQMVLKAFFTDKQIALIAGLDDRANKELAHTLSDYARERWAAGRKVNPALWRLVGKFIDDKIFNDIVIGMVNDDIIEKEAIALAVAESAYPPAKALFKNHLQN